MILFVFEGEKREPELFRAIEKLFFKDSQHIVCSFGNNIYELYQRLKNLDDSGDIVSVLRESMTDELIPHFPEMLKVLTSQRFIWYSTMTSTIGTFCWKR